MSWSRREFLKKTCCTAAAGMAAASFSRMGLMNAMAQTSQDYKALVCVFMFGGNDSNNLIVPLSSSGYASYQQTRAVLALPQASLLPVNPTSMGSPFGFHPKMAEVQALFSGGHAALMANVGTLIRPTTRADVRNGQAVLPQNLFSHADQQTQMQLPHLRAVRRPDGLGEWPTRFRLFTGTASPPQFRSREPTSFARDWWPGPYNPAETRHGCLPDSMDQAKMAPA